MARIDNLTNYLIDVADAIREKKGTTDTIPAASFDTEIKNLPSGGGGGDFSEYLNVVDTNNYKYYGSQYMIKKMPPLELDPNLKTLSMAFMNMYGLETLSLFDTSNITDMNNMFPACSSLKSIPLFDTSNVTNMNGMFLDCVSLPTIPLLNTSKVTNMGSMFANCTSLKTIPQIDTSKVTNIKSIFSGCSALESLPNLNLASATDVRTMFTNVFTTLTDLGGFEDLGKGYLTTRAENYKYYTMDLSTCTGLTHDSLMNVINSVYDIASLGVQKQLLNFGSENLAKLTADEIAIATAKGWNVL